MTLPKPERVERIRALNDHLRKTTVGGRFVITSGIQALGLDGVMVILRALRDFDSFNDANDPHHEHDFGIIELLGETIMFKIDAYDTTLTFGSPDPADDAVTTRVLTLMLASEY